MSRCEVCGVSLDVGAWPFCPHGTYRGSNITDEIPGGFTQENFGHRPETFYSKKAMLHRAKELGLEPMVKWSGPHDRHVSRWVSVDLAAATALVSRSTSIASQDPEPSVEMSFTVKAL